MKKFLAAIICLVMVLGAMTFTASAETEILTDRSIEVEASTAKLYAGETVTVSVVLYGNELASAKWMLKYNPAHFKFLGNPDDTTGVIEGHDFKIDGDVYPNKHTLKTYQFEAIAQYDVTPSSFEIYDTYAYTYMESIDPSDIAASNNGKVDVTIDLIPYTVTRHFDNELIPENENEVTIPYDDKTHKFHIDVDLPDGEDATDAIVKYQILEILDEDVSLFAEVGDEFDSMDQLKDQGVYRIGYKVTPAIGYKPHSGEFTVNIVEPEYVVEVNLAKEEGADYVNNKKIVLVYTKIDNVYFTYNGVTMLDVTNSGYKYKDPETGDEKEYAHVFALVVDAIPGGALEDYEDNVTNIYDDKDVVTVTYGGSTDLNEDDTTDIRDITVVYGVANARAEYFADTRWQKNILKSDIDRNKFVDGEDTGDVVAAVYPQEN